MRALLVLLALLALAPTAAGAFPFGGGSVTTNLNCGATPSQDGCAIFPIPPGNSATLRDGSGDSFQFQGTTVFVNGGAFGGYAQVQINSGGQAFLGTSCPTPSLTLWQTYLNNQLLVTSPTQALPNEFFNTTSGTSFNSWRDLVGDTSYHAGDSLEVRGLPAGLPFYMMSGSSDLTKSGNTVTLDSGAKIGCGVSEGNAVFAFDTSVNTISGVTIKTAVGATVVPEIAYGQDFSGGSFRCINLGHVNGFTITGPIYMHDCDFGIQSGGNNGVVTLTNVLLDHNGSSAPNNSSATHNMYISLVNGATSDTTRVVANGFQSYCQNSQTLPGFQYKIRPQFSQLQTGILAGVDPITFHTDCMESAAADFSCGGYHVLGGAGAGLGVVLEVNVGLVGNGNELVRDYREENSTGNCPAGGWQNTDCQAATLQMLGSSLGCALVIQNAWIINDSGQNIHVVTLGATVPSGFTATVSNSKIVCGAASPCNASFLGISGVTDGGGNTYFVNRAAAGLAACVSRVNCPLPNPM